MTTGAARPAVLTYTEARSSFRATIDAAANGGLPVIARGTDRVAMADAEKLRRALSVLITGRPRVYTEEGLYTLIMEGAGIGTESADFEAAIDDLVVALREYAEDYPRLQNAPNHQENWGLVQLVNLSTDEQLREWMLGQ